MDDQALIDRWCNAQSARGLSPRTIKRRRSTLERFRKAHHLATATATDIEDWLAGLDIQSQSRGLYLGDIHTFYVWALRHDHLTVDPTMKVDPPKRKKYEPKPIAKNQLQAAIAAAPERTRAMLILAGYAGLRAAEIASLRCEDVDHEEGHLRVVGKGDKPRVIQMHRFVAELVEPGSSGPVIRHERHQGKGVSPATVSRVLAKYLKTDRRLEASAHSARHTYGSRMYAECKDLLTVGAQMGHSSTQTTKGYVAFSDDRARAAIQALD